MLAESKLLYAGVRIGTWSILARDMALDMVSAAPAAPQLQQTMTELAVRARYTLLAADLHSISDHFDEIRAAVERHLGPVLS
jgi:hypothetical protein